MRTSFPLRFNSVTGFALWNLKKIPSCHFWQKGTTSHIAVPPFFQKSHIRTFSGFLLMVTGSPGRIKATQSWSSVCFLRECSQHLHSSLAYSTAYSSLLRVLLFQLWVYYNTGTHFVNRGFLLFLILHCKIVTDTASHKNRSLQSETHDFPAR